MEPLTESDVRLIDWAFTAADVQDGTAEPVMDKLRSLIGAVAVLNVDEQQMISQALGNETPSFDSAGTATSFAIRMSADEFSELCRIINRPKFRPVPLVGKADATGRDFEVDRHA